MTKLHFLVGIFLLVILSESTEAMSNINEKLNPTDSIEKLRILLNEMTLEEKVGQLNQYSNFGYTGPSEEDSNGTFIRSKHLRQGLVGAFLNVHGVDEVKKLQKVAVEETRLGIPLLFGFDVIHGYKSIAPIPLAEAASWDLEAIRTSAMIAAEEATAAGINWTFAPMVDISRDPRWGRVMEGAGEDPFLASQIARARVQGFQGKELADQQTMAACAKHFAGYGFVEGGKDYNTSDFSAHTLFNTVLPPFKAAVNAGVKTIMSGFQMLNGVPVSANAYLQKEILKESWGFDGFIVSDWATVKELKIHGYTADEKSSAKAAFLAGLDMDMNSGLLFKHIPSLLKEGVIDEAALDEAVYRILKVKYDLGLFDDPYRYCNNEREARTVRNPDFQSDLLDIAEKSAVLLKNDNAILPLAKSGLSIAVIGSLANDKTSPLGNWRLAAAEEQAVSLWEGLSQFPSSNQLTLAPGMPLLEESPAFSQPAVVNLSDTSGMAQAIRAAESADVVILAVGEHGMMSGEGRSRANLDLPGLQNQLLDEIYAVNENIILVLNTGRPLVLTDIEPKVKSILLAWHLGDQHGNALANLIYGKINPSGKLPMSFPRNRAQIPVYYNHYSTGRPGSSNPRDVFYSHYSDLSNEPLYPFGFGLSYTEFEYSQLEILPVKGKNAGVEIKATVKNVGSKPGREVAQLYMKNHFGDVVQPVRALMGFHSISLNPGESQSLTFLLTSEELGYYNQSGKWIVKPSTYSFFIGSDSNANLTQTVELDLSSSETLPNQHENKK
jgi:beta-glucosidase